MTELACDANEAVKEAKALGRTGLKGLEKRYKLILARGFAANPLPDARGQPRVRGRRKKAKARNLLERLGDYQCEVLRFNLLVPDGVPPLELGSGQRDGRRGPDVVEPEPFNPQGVDEVVNGGVPVAGVHPLVQREDNRHPVCRNGAKRSQGARPPEGVLPRQETGLRDRRQSLIRVLRNAGCSSAYRLFAISTLFARK